MPEAGLPAVLAGTDPAPGRGRRAAGLRTAVAATAAAAVLAMVLVMVHPLPASADPSADSTVTVTVEGGALELAVGTAPTDLGSVDPTSSGTTVSGTLGRVVVTDTRNGAPGSSWVASVVATDFVAEQGPPIPASEVSYTAGPVKGTGVATLEAKDPKNLGRARAAVTATDVTGNNTASWTPTVHVRIPPGLVPGVYTGTITHSVA